MGRVIVDRPGLERLMVVLGGDGETRLVGGAVRDSLAGLPVKDIDLATRLSPREVVSRLEGAEIKAVPTGIAHGTITAVLGSGPVEVTTLRRDVATDGRHATVAYTDDWREDAARRDFTINALYAGHGSGAVFDYFGGQDDLAAGLVRFIGDPLARIAEDHLRILRFFRFHARFGKGDVDRAALDACAVRANDLMTLSRERVADELIKLLSLPDPVAAVTMMVEHGIFRPILPEISSAAHLARLIEREPDPAAIRRLAALLPADPGAVESVAARLRLSKNQAKRLILAAGRAESDAADPRALAYRLGKEAAVDRLLLSGKTAALATLDDWTPPAFPISGGAMVARGVTAGPEVARLLKAVEERWVAEAFPSRERVETLADQAVAGKAFGNL